MNEDIWQAIEDLAHPHEAVRAATTECILAAGEEGIEALRKSALGDDRDVAVRAAGILRELDHPQHFELMRELLGAHDPLVSLLAVKGLERHAEKAIDPLVEALPRCHALILGSALGVLERLGTRKVVVALMGLLPTVEAPTLRYGIIGTLGKLSDTAAIPLIQSFRDDPNPHVRERVDIALERLGAYMSGERDDIGRIRR